MKAKAVLALVAASFLQNCKKPQDPIVFLPEDAPLVAIVFPAESFSSKAKDLVSRLPEARGVFHLIYSVSGLDFLDPQNCKNDGMDPKRSSVLALYDDAFMAIFPLDDEIRAKQRLSLRLARFGFVKEGDVFRHVSSGEKRAVFLVEDTVIALCVGNTKRCTLRTAQSIEEIHQAKEELGIDNSGVLIIIRPSFLTALSRLLPAPMTSLVQHPFLESFAHGRIGIDLDRGIVVSALFGQKGARIQPSPPPFASYEALALVAHMRLPPFLRFDATEIVKTLLGFSLPQDALKDFAFRASLVAPKGKPLHFSISLDFKNEAGASNASTLLAPLLLRSGLQVTSEGRQVIIRNDSVEHRSPQTTISSSLFAFLLNFHEAQTTFDLPSLDFASGLFSALDVAWLNAFIDGPRFRLDVVIRTK